jgi:hypothetical protein
MQPFQFNSPSQTNPIVAKTVGQSSCTQGNQQNTTFIASNRVFHFDLKGAPPKAPYFKEVFSLLKMIGATGSLNYCFYCYGDIQSEISVF